MTIIEVYDVDVNVNVNVDGELCLCHEGRRAFYVYIALHNTIYDIYIYIHRERRNT